MQSPMLQGGRQRQKRRTRAALLDAANRLVAAGTAPSIEAVAQEAGVSRATAYRYYGSADALVVDAFYERSLPAIEEVFREVAHDPVARVLAVETAVHTLLLRDEVAMRVIVRNGIDAALRKPGGEVRSARRLALLDAALAPWAAQLGRRRLRRLRNALATVIGTEALLALRDLCRVDIAEARATARDSAETIVRAAFA